MQSLEDDNLCKKIERLALKHRNAHASELAAKAEIERVDKKVAGFMKLAKVRESDLWLPKEDATNKYTIAPARIEQVKLLTCGTAHYETKHCNTCRSRLPPKVSPEMLLSPGIFLPTRTKHLYHARLLAPIEFQSPPKEVMSPVCKRV
jgi:hypothetical protein